MRRPFLLAIILGIATATFAISQSSTGNSSLKGTGRPGADGAGETGPVNGAIYDRAIAPYVAKARATYPGAKKRFLAGLPPGYTFSVWIRLVQLPSKGKRGRFEDVFVTVDTIKNSKVTGRIANIPDNVTNYHEGQQITVPEAEVRNWVIVRPDGSEEGNYVGKFLEAQSKHR
jgi:uncharacterized protein YegJ (DUF2314 family)